MKTLPLLLLLALSIQAQRQEFIKKEFHTKEGFVLPYRILYPLNYNPKVAYPVVLFLHGVLERGSDNEQQLVNGADLFLSKKNRKNFPAIVIFPQCPQNDYWASVDIDQSRLPIEIRYRYNAPPTPAMNACMELLSSLITGKKADKNRIYVMGLSMGGMGTLEVISRYPEFFAAAVPICGAGDTSYCKKYAGKVALWLFHGEADAGMDPELSRSIVRTLKSLGTPPRYTEYPGVGHNSWDKAFAEPELLSWMFRQKKRKGYLLPAITGK